MEVLNFNQSYTGGGILNTVKSFLPIVCGVPASIIDSTNKKYSVYISTNGTPPIHVFAWLQEKFEFNVSSSWTDIAKIDLPDVIKDVAQIASGKVFAPTIATRRKWRGSSPINLTLKLKFEAINDVKKEVLTPCLELQRLVLPSGGTTTGEKIMLTPPGPNPFYVDALKNKYGGKRFNQGENVSMDIGGGFIKFDQVIIQSVRVVYESRMAAEGPIGAEAVVEFQTYEMLTRERLDEAYGNII